MTDLLDRLVEAHGGLKRWNELQVQTVYVGDDGLIRREDYEVDILGGSAGAHYMSGYTGVAGIMLPTGHRIFPRTPEGQALSEPLLVSIDLSEITFA